ncbi:MAG: ATP-binding protein [Armatimonadota bacterium]
MITFVNGIEGTLIRIQEDPEARYEFEIWFDYTRQAMNLIREGALLAVPNFASEQGESHRSILEVVSILPIHYGLGDNPQGYPGFVVEAARSAVRDWEEQEHEPTEDVTKIRCIAIPTNLEIVEQDGQSRLQEESNLPMVGARALLLDTPSTEYVLNSGLPQRVPTFIVGNLTRDPQVGVKTSAEDLLRTHFAIFGFTGAGKSNLVSTLVDRVLYAFSVEDPAQEPLRENVKVVLFDLMSEYSVLLADWLVKAPDACLVVLTEETLPEDVLQFMEQPTNRETFSKALTALTQTTLYPKALSGRRSDFWFAWRRLLNPKSARIRLYREKPPTLGKLVERHWAPKGTLGKNDAQIRQQVRNWIASEDTTPFNEETAPRLMGWIENMFNSGLLSTNDAREAFQALRDAVDDAFRRYISPRHVYDAYQMTLGELVNKLNDPHTSGLYVIQSHDPDRLRDFAATLGEVMFENRRKTGKINPLVVFVFDEADEFIPQRREGADDSYARSRIVVMTLARRGRKFGLGVGIATQRVRYLDTSIMAQPHTYFVSKMPRQSDRQAIAEAFGISEEMFGQTFKFKKGDWLLMSHDAAGLEAVPIPIHCEDANLRVEAYLDHLKAEWQKTREMARTRT